MKYLSLILISAVGLAQLGLAQDAENGGELLTEVFQTPRSIFTAHSNLKARSFSTSEVGQSGRGVSMLAVLEDFGIQFSAGCSAVYNPVDGRTIVRNTKEQLALVEALFETIQIESAPKQMHIFLEYIEMESDLYHDWMFENRMTGDATPLRKQAQKWIKSGEATLFEAVGITARSGQRAKTESVSETIFPTEPGVPEVPNEAVLEGADSKGPIARSVPTAFETRDAGTVFEVDPVLGADNWTIDLNLNPAISKLMGYDHWPPENELPLFTFSTPRFHKMAITTQVTMLRGTYLLIGTVRPDKATVETRKKPMILVFVRPDISGVAMPKINKRGEPK